MTDYPLHLILWPARITPLRDHWWVLGVVVGVKVTEGLEARASLL